VLTVSAAWRCSIDEVCLDVLCRLSKGIEARDQILEQVETLLRAREAKREASGSSAGAVVHRNVHDYTLDDQRALVS
jgi:UDP-N-acetylenolpyruvoylglucosamine reductase